MDDDDSYVSATELDEHRMWAHRERIEFLLSEINKGISGMTHALIFVATLLGFLLWRLWR